MAKMSKSGTGSATYGTPTNMKTVAKVASGAVDGGSTVAKVPKANK